MTGELSDECQAPGLGGVLSLAEGYIGSVLPPPKCIASGPPLKSPAAPIFRE